MRRKVLFVIQAIWLALLVGAVAASAREDGLPRPSSVVQRPSSSQTVPFSPVGTAFTYQRQLKDGGNPANGQYDLQFTLFDAAAGGSQVGSTQELLNQTVTDGLFTVQLDFGTSAFQGDARWLEIAVR